MLKQKNISVNFGGYMDMESKNTHVITKTYPLFFFIVMNFEKFKKFYRHNTLLSTYMYIP